MFGPGFRSLATLKLVVNVVGELYTEKNSCDITRFPCDITAFLFFFSHYEPVRDKPTDRRTGKTRCAAYRTAVQQMY